jgi:ligand-binding sensor domain-containing protein/two-component sensor histidine kinase
MRLTTLFWFHLVLLSTLQVTGQTTFIKEVGQHNGLPTRSIYDLFIDKDGFLYLGTEIGMFRYNGIEFHRKVFLNNKGNSVNDIHQDESGTIWCMNFSNQIFFLENDTLKAHKAINQKIEESGPLRAYAVAGNDIWIVTDKLVFVYRQGEIISVMNKPPDYRNNLFHTIFVHPVTKRIFILDSEFIYEIKDYRFSKKHKLALPSQYELVFLNDQLVTFQKRNPRINQVFNQRISRITPDILPEAYLNKSIVIDNSIWLCTNNGLYELNMQLSKRISQNLNGIRVSDIVKDKEGGLWISSVEKGLFYIPDRRVKALKVSPFNHNVISQGPDNTLFVGTGNGEIIQLSSNGTILNSYSSELLTEVEFIYYDSHDRRIISNHGIIDLKNPQKNISLYLGKAVAPDVYGNFLFAYYNKAFLTNQDFLQAPTVSMGFEISPVKLQDRIPHIEIRLNRAKSVLFDPNNDHYYVGYADKLIRYNKTGSVKEIKSTDQKDIIANHMLLQQNGDILIGSIQDGVHIIKNGKAIKHFSVQAGLSSNTVRKILLKDDQLYVLTDIGLDIIHLKKGTIRPFPMFQFFYGMNFSDMIVANGNLWLAGIDELIILPMSLNSRISLPKIHEIQTLVNENLTQLNGSKISYNKNQIRINLDAIHFQSSGQFDYAYRLKGYDNNWTTQPAMNKSINYLSLPPGEYIFEVKTGLNGAYSYPVRIRFEIAPPFWTTWWFRLLIILSLGAVIYFLFKQNLQRIRKKQLIKERLLISQLIALRSQMNPHFMFNVLNSVQGLIYADKKNEASLYLGKFSTLMRRMLEFSDKAQLSLEKELELIQTYLELEAARFDGELNYRIQHELSTEELEQEIPSMIIQPYVENAIKHGLLHKKGNKQLTIYVNLSSQKDLEIRIVDNGIGREMSKQINAKRTHHKSFATVAIDSRIGLINRIRKKPIQLTIHDRFDAHGKAEGTEVVILIPNENEHETSTDN